MADRTTPYGSFDYVVRFDGGEVFGGFSEVSGIGAERTIAESLDGNVSRIRRLGGVPKVPDVTLKRGVVSSKSLRDWLRETRTGGSMARKTVSITLLDEARAPVRSWVLRGVLPMKYAAPALAGEGGGDVAMEELVLSAEGLATGP